MRECLRKRIVGERKIGLYMILLFVFILLGAVCSAKICNIVFASSERYEMQQKRFISIEIEEGDTLWNLAVEYYPVSGRNGIREYVKEIKACNGLQEDTIHTGSYLVIPYMQNVKEKRGQGE